MSQYPVNLVILAWNNRRDLQNCIESIMRSTTVSYQLIVVNNGSVDDTREYLDNLEVQWKSQNILTVIHNETNLGYAQGNNVSLPFLEGQYTLFLNQDIVVQEGSIDHLVSFIQEHSDQYQAIAPQLRYPDGRIQESCRALPTPQSMMTSIFRRGWYSRFDHTQSQVCEQPMASAIMIRTDIVKDLGGFDDHKDYWLFFNDVDLSKRLSEKGYKTYFLAESVMEHHHGASTKKLLNWKKRMYWYRGFMRYFGKWHQESPIAYIRNSLLGVSIIFGLLVRDLLKRLL